MGWNFDGTVRRRYAFREPQVEVKKDETKILTRVMNVLLRVLPGFPEARAAVIQALRETFLNAQEPVPEWAT